MSLTLTRSFAAILCCLLAVFAAACEPEATPLPVNMEPLETETPAPDPAQVGTEGQMQAGARYAVVNNIRETLLNLYPAALEQMQASANVELLTTDEINPADFGTRYDLVLAYGDLPGGTRAPATVHVALIANPARVPLDDAEVVNVVWHSVSPQAVVSGLADVPGVTTESTAPAAALSQFQVELANAGWPDGFAVNMGYVPVPGAGEVVNQLRVLFPALTLTSMNNDSIKTNLDGLVSLALVTWNTPAERETWITLVGETHFFDLYTLPVSYWAADGLSITFTPDGWPLAEK